MRALASRWGVFFAAALLALSVAAALAEEGTAKQKPAPAAKEGASEQKPAQPRQANPAPGPGKEPAPPAKQPAPKAGTAEAPVPAQPRPAAAPPPEPAPKPPPEGRDIPLKGLPEPACRDIYDLAINTAIIKLNYTKGEQEAPERTVGFTEYCYLTRPDGAARRVLIVGLKSYVTQPSHLYLWGGTFQGARAWANPDLDALTAAVQEGIKAQATPRTYSVRELSHETYQLSCIDTDSCIKILGELGYNTAAPKGAVKLSQLPAIIKLDVPQARSIVTDVDRVSTTKLDAPTISAPENRLLILYHSSQTRELEKLKELITNTIDVPERQVLIEGMVIDLTQDSYREMATELGLYTASYQRAEFAEEAATGYSPLTLFFHRTDLPTPAGLADRLKATIRMILDEGQGEVLSSPQVLVLNNRNAVIQVIHEVPVFQTLITQRTTEVKISFKTVGIMLNIKPRISRDDSTVAMQILVEVSEAPREDYIVVAVRGEQQSVAPLISRRIVQTVARVKNNTPFIIGGLIRNEKARTLGRVPVLSRIPILGVLFKNRTRRQERNEVIIVLTPRVISSEGGNRPVLPKDTARFDFLNNQLFRNSYRLKADDVFDLEFLEQNPTLRAAFRRVHEFVVEHPEYASRSPFKEMADGVIPGEDAVVVRMIYEVVKKLGLHELLDPERIIFFQQPPSFDVDWLARQIEQRSPDGTLSGYFSRPYPKEVPLIHVRLQGDRGRESALKAAEGRVEWLSVANEQELSKIIATANAGGAERQSFVFCPKSEGELDAMRAAGMELYRLGDWTPAGFRVVFLNGLLSKYSPDGTVDGYFNRPYPKDVLFFRYKVPEGQLKEALQSPVAHVEAVRVQSREEVESRLLDINRLGDDYRYREFAFVLDTRKDLDRLKAAICLREVAKVNNFEELMMLRNFRVGRRIVIPQLAGENERIFLIDQSVARYFFESDYYYTVLKERLEAGYRIVDEVLRRGGKR